MKILVPEKEFVVAELGSHIAVANQTASLISAVSVGADRRMRVGWVAGTGEWHLLVSFGGPFAPPGAAVAMADHGVTDPTSRCQAKRRRAPIRGHPRSRSGNGAFGHWFEPA